MLPTLIYGLHTLLGLHLAAAPSRAPVVIYDDAPRSGFADATWGRHRLAQGYAVHAGRAALALYPRAGRAFTLRRATPLSLSGLATLQLWVCASGAGTQQAELAVLHDDGRSEAVPLAAYLPSAALQSRWQRARIPLSALGGSAAPVVAVQLRNAGRRAMEPLFVDDVALLPPPPPGWLHVGGRRIRDASDRVWAGRGASIADTRSCGACAATPSRAEVLRRIDELVRWGADFIRLNLESYTRSGLLGDAAYEADLQAIVAYIGARPRLYVELGLWVDPTLARTGVPTAATRAAMRRLVDLFHASPHVLLGVAAEPAGNDDGRADAENWAAMDTLVAAVRDAESAYADPAHVVVVPGTGAWGARLQPYERRPIAAGGGTDVAYAVHLADPAGALDALLARPAARLPVVVGAFGPVVGRMTLGDCAALMDRAERLGVPYLAWTFHMRCPPSLIEDTSGGGCGVDMPLAPTEWGRCLRERLRQPQAIAIDPAG